MKPVLLMAWRYMAFNRVITFILITCITITISLPVSVYILVHYYNTELNARAKTTPLIIGAKGNRYDLVLKSLYFNAERPDPISMKEVEDVDDTELGLPIPLYIRFTARKFPVVGTSLEYFEFRGLELEEGALPMMLGDAVVGSNVAKQLGLKPGGSIISDQENLYDISTTYPLNMTITGVLKESHSPDDNAVFVDVKTTWIIQGIVHGHMDVTKGAVDEGIIMDRTGKNVVTNAAVIEYQKITQDNIDSFHMHGGPEAFPLTSVIVLPNDTKSATILKGKYRVKKMEQMLVPDRVIQELMGIVFKVKKFFDLNFAMVTFSTVLFLVLVILLSLRIRKNEMDTMHKIGCSRMIVFWLQASELGIVMFVSLGLTGIFSYALVLKAQELIKTLF